MSSKTPQALRTNERDRHLELEVATCVGGVVSPALANHYLRSFDRAVDGLIGRLVRYADDVAVFCADEEAAQTARWEVERALGALDLRLADEKSYVSHFDRGFSFLGWVFFRDDGYEEAPTQGWTHPMSVGRRGRSA